MRKRVHAGLFALSFFLPAEAIVIRTYDASRHRRFDSFPATPTKNPTQIFAALDLTGIGWSASYGGVQFALVSRQHVVFATHWAPTFPAPIRFANASGTVHTRNQASGFVIQDGGNNSDLTLITLASPLDADSGIAPLAYLDLPNELAYQNLTIGVAAQHHTGGAGDSPDIGEGTIANVELVSRTEDYGDSFGFQTTRYMRFDYTRDPILFPSPDPDDAHFESGDSGGPTFVNSGGKAALVGVHSYVTGFHEMPPPPPDETFENYDVFVPHYASSLNVQMAPLGYRMRPVNADPTTLSTATEVTQTTPRKALPLNFDYDLENTGANLTGNLEVEFNFDPAEAPDSITVPGGWVSYGSGAKWTIRKATLAPAATATFTANWATAPSVDTLAVTLVCRSDTTADSTLPLEIDLAPSFADWASALSESGENDDPDGDGLENVIEYALGGDPESGALVFADGGPLTPVIGKSGGTITVSFPERTDKVLRGLSYTLEFSGTLAGWTDTPPVGIGTSTSPYAPEVDGFVKRTYTWPADPDRGFARLRIDLAE